MSAGPTTRTSTRRLSEVARHLVVPPGIVTTAWPRVHRRLRSIGIEFDLWQQGLAQLVLGRRKNDKYAATVGGVVLSIPRQVGKTFFVMALLVAMCLEYPGFRVIWTSHHMRTTTNTFRAMQGMARRKRVAPYVSAIRTANGEGEVVFHNGSIIMFGARSQGFGRGFDKIDVEVFDEAQILDSRSLEDMVAATNQAQHPHGALLFFMGTPPRPIDPGEEFTNRRAKALSGKWRDGIYVEFSADPDADPDDWEQIGKANPSYPDRTPREAIERLRENLTDVESWMREGLGVWQPKGAQAVIPAQLWADAADSVSLAVDRYALGVEVAPDAERASVALAGVREDGAWHVELDEAREGVAWVVPYVKALLAANPQVRGVGVDAGSPSKVLLEEFAAAGVRVITPKVQDLGAACTAVLSGVITGEVKHIDQGQLNTAVAVAGKRRLGDTGMWVWSRSTAAADITPVQAVTLALWVAQLDKVYRAPLRPVGDDGSVVVL